jgi:hypothetical protein
MMVLLRYAPRIRGAIHGTYVIVKPNAEATLGSQVERIGGEYVRGAAALSREIR